MVFSIYHFLFLFFPVAVLGYHLLRRANRALWVKLWLAAVSLVFYAMGQLNFLPGLVLTVAVNYLILLAMQRSAGAKARTALLIGSVLWNVGLLGYLKYADFLMQSVSWALHRPFDPAGVLAPLGISFLTLQMLALAVGIFRGTDRLPPLPDYLVCVTFFPKLILGPVTEHGELSGQIGGDALLRFDRVWIFRGVMLFAVGCAKKTLLANPMFDYASGFFGGDVMQFSGPEAWVALFSYVFAYYLGFSGCLDMARGLGCFFGIALPVSFDSPYRARSLAEFWSRWNMTVTRFFRETVFETLLRGGAGRIGLDLALLVTFALFGLWHGAGWHCLVWGVLNGILVLFVWLRRDAGRRPLPKVLAVALTFLTGAVLRVLFVSGIGQSLAIYRKLFDPRLWKAGMSLTAIAARLVKGQPLLLPVLAVSAAICFFAPNSNRIIERERFGVRDAIFCGVLMGLSIMFLSETSGNLYFNF